jgi:MHS family proline/betaine transporter-like MFS transporter
MNFFRKLDKEVQQAVKLLTLGTFLEYFDLFLYAHMAVVLNELFFPPTDPYNQSLLTAFAFCSSFIFRPFGAMLFGYIGDKYGRKITIVITTFMMAVTCLIMANAPTYAQAGAAAAWIVTICRIIQGISSMGEIVGAQLFLTEATPLSYRFPVVGLISVAGDLGGILAITVAVVSTGHGFNWRIAFWIGALIALIGSAARRSLRESPEYADARKRLESVAKRAGESIQDIKKGNFWNEKVAYKLSLSYFLIKCNGPVFLYFVYFYITTAFKDVLHYTPHEILLHNLSVGFIQLTWTVIRVYLSTKIHPLRVLNFFWTLSLIFIPFLPLFLNHITAPWQLFLLQCLIMIIIPTDLPAVPIFFKSFPVYKRFSYISVLFALAYAVIYAITSYGLAYLIAYFGYSGLLILMIPVLIGYGYGLNYFKKLEKAADRYPKIQLWRELDNGGTEFYKI